MAKGPKKKMAKGKKNGKIGTTGTRSRADKVLAQAVGTSVSKAFGNAQRRRKGGLSKHFHGWNAFHPLHCPLPRSVGPYAVVRTTVPISSAAKVLLFGTYYNPANEKWSNAICMSSVDSTLPINSANNTRKFNVPAPVAVAGANSTACLVPAAISVQIMNGNALQSTAGIIYGAVCGTNLSVNSRTDTWDTLGSELVAYMKPRLVSAGKLALRGVQMDSYPLDMSDLASFKPGVIDASLSTDFTYNGDDHPLPHGWAPMMVYNTNGVTLDYLVCVEWRVRFDISNPAVAAHTHHNVTPDSTWNSWVRSAQGIGSGMRDIAEVVASGVEAARAVGAVAGAL